MTQKLFFVFFWSLFLNFIPSKVGAAPDDGTGWAYQTLDLEITFHPEETAISVEGRAILKLEENTSYGPTLALNLNSTLDLRKKIMAFTEVDAGEGAEVQINILPEDGSHDRAKETSLANIRFAKPFQAGDVIEVKFSLKSVGQAFQFKISDTNAVGSYEAAWYPVPISGPNQTESRLRRAAGEMRFHLPPGIHAFTNGQLTQSQETPSGVSEVWTIEEPKARSFVLGPFEIQRFEIEGKGFAVYLLPEENRPDWTRGKVIPAKDMLDGLTNAIRIFSEAYGPFPFESFGVVEVPNTLVNWWGSLEEGFMIGTSGSLSSGNMGVLDNISHEVSHAWWGANVEGAGPGAYLLSESLANFSTRYFFEKTVGIELATHLFRFGSAGSPLDFNYGAYGYFNQIRKGFDAPLSGLVSGNSENYNLASAKGGLFYNLLRTQVNDDALFFSILKNLQDRFSGGHLTLTDLREAFINGVPPELKLPQFFSEWLDGLGAPKLEADFKEVSDTEVEVTIRQVQTVDPFHLNLELDVFADGDPVRHTIEIEGRETTVVLEKQGGVHGLVIDPAHKLLIWTPDYGPYQ